MRAYNKRKDSRYTKKYRRIAEARAYQALMDDPKTKWPYLRARVLERQAWRRSLKSPIQSLMGNWTSIGLPITLFTQNE